MLPKLVRDKVPRNIVKDGKIPICEFVDDFNVEPHIFNKIREEVAELQYECTGPELSRNKILEEFADVFEVLYKLADLYNISIEDIDESRSIKCVRCGRFEDNIILTDIKFKGDEKK